MSAWPWSSAIAVLKRYRVPYTVERDTIWYDGRRISASRKVKPQDIMHEAAHWFLSSTDLRRVVNFGLGPDPDGATPRNIDSPEIVEDSIQEEIFVSGAGILLTAMIGGDFKKNLDDHTWGNMLKKDEVWEMRESARRLRLAGVELPKSVELKVVWTLAGIRGQHCKRLPVHLRPKRRR